MSTSIMKPKSRDELVELLKSAMKREMNIRKAKGLAVKPTISGTAKVLGIHLSLMHI